MPRRTTRCSNGLDRLVEESRATEVCVIGSRPTVLDGPVRLVETARSCMRVIAGELGGRRLSAPRGRDTRPTSDRVRESLFMILEPLTGLSVVDLFAGSGALGIEALSRGARWVDFVEVQAEARRVLEGNLRSLGLGDRARVWALRLPGGFTRLGDVLAGADLVLADPPYGGREAVLTLEALGSPEVLRVGTRVVVEHHRKDALPERAGGLACEQRRRYGETVVSVYRRQDVTRTSEEGR